MAELWLTVKQAAQELGISPRTVRQWLRRGKLVGKKVRGKRCREWRVSADSVRRNKSARDAARGIQDAESAPSGRGNELAALVESLLAEIRSLREENAEYRQHLERLTMEIEELREQLLPALPPGEGAESQAKKQPWWLRLFAWRRKTYGDAS